MTYDFRTTINRLPQGSAKWQQMMDLNPKIEEDVVPYSVADVDLPHPPELIDGLQEYIQEMIFGYTGLTNTYLETVVNWFERHHQWKISPETIVPSPGVVSALFNTVKAYTRIGDSVLIISPVYYPFRNAILKSGRQVLSSPLIERNGEYTIDFTDLENKASQPDVGLLLFCSPHNPVGRVWKKEELEKVDQICRKHNVILVSDEIHFDLILPGHSHTVFSTLSPETSENTIVFTAPSKTFNLAGLQTANVVITNPQLRQAFIDQQSRDGFHMLNCIGPKACEIMYQHGELWLKEFLSLIEHNRQTFEQYVTQHLPMIKLTPLEGTYLQWFDCRALRMSDEELDDFLIKDCQLILDAGHIFGPEGSGYQRINLACSTEKLQDGLQRLKTAVHQRTSF